MNIRCLLSFRFQRLFDSCDDSLPEAARHCHSCPSVGVWDIFSPRIRQVSFPIAGQSAEGPRAMSFLFAMATAAMPGDLHTPRKSRHSSVGTSARAALMSSPAGPIPRLPRHGQPPRERWPARPHEAAGEPNAATRRGRESQYVYYICFRVRRGWLRCLARPEADSAAAPHW